MRFSLKTNKTDYAGLLPRGIAYLIDCAAAFGFFTLTQLLIFRPLRGALGMGSEWFHSGVHTQIYTLMTISIPVWLYFALFDFSTWRATPGKRIMKLRTVSVSDRSRIRFSRSLLRTVVKLLPWEIAHLTNNFPKPLWFVQEPEFRAGFALAGLLMGLYIGVAGWTCKKQAPHDLLAGTVVLKSK